MGQAARIAAERRKQKERDEMGALLLKEATRWGQAAEPYEKVWISHLMALPQEEVTRPPAQQLLRGGMVPKECHKNCFYQVKNDPSGAWKYVAGWWVQGGVLVLHSVAETNGRLYCLTPQVLDSLGETFLFIRDPEIKWVEVGNGEKELKRDGVDVPVGLRQDPDKHVRMLARINSLIAEGNHPLDAYKVADGEYGEGLFDTKKS